MTHSMTKMSRSEAHERNFFSNKCKAICGLETSGVIFVLTRESKKMKESRMKKSIVVLLSATSIAALAAASHGTDILHFFVRKAMSNAGVDTNASGSVAARQNEQGHANNQTLEILSKGLDTNTSYQLMAMVGDATNFTLVTNFNSDSRGRLNLRFRDLGNGHGVGHGRLPLPDALDPVSQVREVAIYNSSTQAVLTADLTLPDRLEYLIKRDLSSNSVDAMLRLHANTHQTQFRLTASGLNPTNDYLLVLNGGIVQTNDTDSKGRLVIRSFLETPTDILQVRSLELWDNASNVVLSTTLP